MELLVVILSSETQYQGILKKKYGGSGLFMVILFLILDLTSLIYEIYIAFESKSFCIIFLFFSFT